MGGDTVVDRGGEGMWMYEVLRGRLMTWEWSGSKDDGCMDSGL